MRLRGRKGIREELEQQPKLVVLNPFEYKGRWREFFGNDQPLHVELGMGKGQFISGMCRKHPQSNFIGIDMYDELVRRASVKARRLPGAGPDDVLGVPPANLALVRGNIEQIGDFFADNELTCIYLNFSDPWPKIRHAKRRLTHPRLLEIYRRLLNEHGQIHQKTDSRELFEFSLNSYLEMDMKLQRISLDLHRDGIDPDRVMTEYESKFVKRGLPIYRCEVLVGEEARRGR
ncbi:MAG: tRNA (guanine-N7)-methyltransferase [Paenibacillaceae bacterium]|nr:tRNA (guanine-N7)-methyltransferase [Paenibacillaceae bacterium]